MNGHQYEHQCAKRLKNKGFYKVTVTKGSGDQGIDVIAYSGGKKYGIQCKHYSSPVGNHAVQEAFAGARYYNCNVAVVMTNNTFTRSAKDLASKTDVLLWDKNKIPSGTNGFWLTKYVGLFVFIMGILALITMWKADNIKLPALQIVGMVSLILGGLFAVFEYGNWKMSFLSGITYFFAGFINIIFTFITKSKFGYDLIFFLTVVLISFIRANYLYKRVNGFYIWKNGFRGFINSSFR